MKTHLYTSPNTEPIRQRIFRAATEPRTIRKTIGKQLPTKLITSTRENSNEIIPKKTTLKYSKYKTLYSLLILMSSLLRKSRTKRAKKSN